MDLSQSQQYFEISSWLEWFQKVIPSAKASESLYLLQITSPCHFVFTFPLPLLLTANKVSNLSFKVNSTIWQATEENLDPVDNRGCEGEGASMAILVWRWSSGVTICMYSRCFWLLSARRLPRCWMVRGRQYHSNRKESWKWNKVVFLPFVSLQLKTTAGLHIGHDNIRRANLGQNRCMVFSTGDISGVLIGQLTNKLGLVSIWAHSLQNPSKTQVKHFYRLDFGKRRVALRKPIRK